MSRVVLEASRGAGRFGGDPHHLRTPQERAGSLQQGDPGLFQFGRRPRRDHRAGQLDRGAAPRKGQDRKGESEV